MRDSDTIILENLYSEVYNITESNNPVSVKGFHGGGWDGKGTPFIRDGEYGTGVYFTNSLKVAEYYARDVSRHSKNRSTAYIVECELHFNNPLQVKAENGKPLYPAHILIQLGMDRNKAIDRIEKQFEKTGNAGPIIRKTATSKGYDGLILEKSNGFEYVVWFPETLKVLNVDTIAL